MSKKSKRSILHAKLNEMPLEAQKSTCMQHHYIANHNFNRIWPYTVHVHCTKYIRNAKRALTLNAPILAKPSKNLKQNTIFHDICIWYTYKRYENRHTEWQIRGTNEIEKYVSNQNGWFWRERIKLWKKSLLSEQANKKKKLPQKNYNLNRVYK